MAFETQISRHSFLSQAGLTHDGGVPDTIIFFVTGNPGLICYYHDFLALLADNLTSPKDDAKSDSHDQDGSYLIYGTSLAAIGSDDIHDSEGKAKGSYGKTLAEKDFEYYDLDEQNGFVERNLLSLVARWKTRQEDPRKTPKVIIVGHSMGGYISMELLRRHRERGSRDMNIIGEILLFPTVVDIAKSPKGALFMILNRIPYLAFWASLLVKFLVALIPTFLLRLLVQIVMRFPPRNAVDATMDLLQHRTAIYEVIYLAQYEMREIQADKWDDELWAISPPATGEAQDQSAKHRLIFYFGRDDHWVSNSTRDSIIATKEAQKAKLGSDPERLKFIVCQDEVAHGFCIRHSDIMARKTAGFVREISRAHS